MVTEVIIAQYDIIRCPEPHQSIVTSLIKMRVVRAYISFIARLSPASPASVVVILVSVVTLHLIPLVRTSILEEAVDLLNIAII